MPDRLELGVGRLQPDSTALSEVSFERYATVLEKGADAEVEEWAFVLPTDGSGADDLIVRGGGFRQRFPDEQPYVYQPFAGHEDEYRWSPELMATLKDYNLQDIGI